MLDKIRKIIILYSMAFKILFISSALLLFGLTILYASTLNTGRRLLTASYYSEASLKAEGSWEKWGGKTASGEQFYDCLLTCASWDYAFGTYLVVTNTENMRSVTVKVNDRGPNEKLYRSGRVIDLSKRAFSEIADLDTGIIPIYVRVKP